MFKHIAILVPAVAKSFLAKAKNEMNKIKRHTTMCIVHSTLRDATTPYTERYNQLPTPENKAQKNPSYSEGFCMIYKLFLNN